MNQLAAPASLASSGVSNLSRDESTSLSGQPGTEPRPVPPATQSVITDNPKPPFPAAALLPTQHGPHGIRFDFNDGARLSVPEGAWHSVLRDLDTGNILFATDKGNVTVNSSKRYFVRFGIEVRDGAGRIAFAHDFDASDQEVLISLPVGTLGDSLGWMPFAARFGAVHRCKLTVALAECLIPLFRDAYPDVTFVTAENIKTEQFYATYNIGLFFDDAACERQPTDFRHVGLHRTAGYILGVDPTEERPRITVSDESRPIPEPYVCIGTQSSTQCKYWNNPHGWREVVAFLKRSGFRVVCIDQKPVHGTGMVWNHIPHGAEDETGDRPLAERARWLSHASFFIGLSSGLSWLAWATETPVVMISGFTHPTNEFATPFRVVNWHACNSCWNDPRVRFDHNDFLWCPRHRNTPRQFECSRLITATQVINTIRRVPAFADALRPDFTQPIEAAFASGLDHEGRQPQ